MRRRRPKLQRIRFRVFDERVREALKTMTASAGLAREIEDAVERAGPVASPAGYFVLERSEDALVLRQVRPAGSGGAEAAAGTETVTLWPLTAARPAGSAGSPPPRSGA